MTYWQECRWACRVVWKNPWWYVALLLFVFGPFLSRDGVYVWRWPWWSLVYIPVMTAFVILLGVLRRRTEEMDGPQPSAGQSEETPKTPPQTGGT